MQDEEMDALMIQFMARTTDRIDEAEDRALERGIEIGRAAGMEFGKALRLERVQRETTLRIASRLLPLEVVNRLRLIQDPEALADAAADAIRARMH